MAIACFIIAGILLTGITIVDAFSRYVEQTIIEADHILAVNDQFKKK